MDSPQDVPQHSTWPGDALYEVYSPSTEDLAAYGARTAFEHTKAAWRQLFEERPDAPERLLSVALLTELTP